ncbi:hypothetical protein OVN18_10750 [Microcella daejeonensis]|uniref:Nuclear transport factor 2 family protein n=1 Tax=Microcella daejeonensis TaxID=2994971 RepID=A0A9E8MK54_9MICO|nr:hypothetical protein [Microcella daejeonensis]WAB81027.1 hypothetical protein OVN18_10750 [Microcella daejeonensis]
MPTIRARRALPPRSLVLPATAALLVALAGCSDTPAIPDADPTPTASPLFASEEEALKAATAVYEEYLAIGGAILQDSGSAPERLEPLLTEEIYEDELASIETTVAAGERWTGSLRLTGVKLQQYANDASGGIELQMYACVTNEDVRIFDATGEDVTNPDRVNLGTFDVVVESTSDGRLVIAQRDYWSEGDECAE